MQDSRIAQIDAAAARAVDAVLREDRFDAAVPALLLRHYLTSGRTELSEALGLALAQALARAAAEPTVIGRAAWLTLLVEATAVADDDRILPAVGELLAGLQAEWPAQTRIDEMSASVEACLRAAEIVSPDELVQHAIDHLEHAIGGSYRPGDGLMRDRDGIRVRCSLDDHVRGASALLTAFELTGRLPYSMLAEELIAIVRRDAGSLAIQCETVRVLCRLADLHDDPDYRGAAVIADGADYRAEAARILEAECDRARAATPSDAAAYALALLDLLK